MQVHVETIYEVQFPDKVWSLIKEFMIYEKDYCNLVTYYGALIDHVLEGKFVYFPYIYLKRITKIIINETPLTDIEVILICNTNSQ